MHASNAPDHILNARLPRWLLPHAWPTSAGQPNRMVTNTSNQKLRPRIANRMMIT